MRRLMRMTLLSTVLLWGPSHARAAAPTDLLVNNGNGTFKDQATGLVWQAAYNPASTWSAAGATCAALVLAGGGWRLPTILELSTTIDETSYQLYNLFERPTVLTTGAQPWYWTSTADVVDATRRWAMLFRSRADRASLDPSNYPSQTKPMDSTSLLYSRCVR
jgi:hypothetical protein